MENNDGIKNGKEVEGHGDVELYGDEGIASRDAPFPLWLKFSYVLWPLVGFCVFYLFWNGSVGWFDRGYWNELQRAANTVYPFTTTELVEHHYDTLKDKP